MSGIVPEVLKMLVFFFPVFWAFVGWLILVYFGFGRFRCFVIIVFVFVFCVAFVSVLFALFLFCCWIVFGVGSCFVFFSCFLLLFFVGFFAGFKGQVRWPKGPPRLALNPPYCLFVVFFCWIVFGVGFLFLLFFFWEGLRVR